MNKIKFAKITLGFVTAVAMMGGVAVLPAVAADDLAAQIAALMAQIQVLQAKLAAQPGAAVSYTFSANLTVGSRGADVAALQKALNGDADTQVAVSGAGSPGNETEYFGNATKAAVMKFQKKYSISPVAGYVGAITRAKLNSLGGVAVVPATPATPVTPVTPVTPAAPVIGGNLIVSVPAQPANQLAPKSAVRIPFTKVTLTAVSSDITVNNITVERKGDSADAALNGIVLMDESGTQLGIAKTLNSVHQAVVGDAFVVKAGTSKTVTIGGNRPSTATDGGNSIVLRIVSINTAGGATVGGVALPIDGASHTANTALTIGSVTMSRGSLDPGSSQTKEIGTLAYTFSGVKVTAGSTEDITLKSIRWNQTGTAGVADISNLKTYVDGVGYDLVVSSDGKYYTAVFGDGLAIAKGFSKDISIKGDVSGGSNRTIAFEIAKMTDISIVGNTYGYGILPPQTGTTAYTSTSNASNFSSSEDPWYSGAKVTVSNGTMTVTADSSIAAQNIAVNLADQVLGGFLVEVRGESITVASTLIGISTKLAGTGVTSGITNIKLVDGNGAVLAGPVDGAVVLGEHGKATFTDTITYPIGTTKVIVKGKLGTTFVSNDTVQASTTPSTDWTTVKGTITNNTITPSPASVITSNAMTVKAGALKVQAAATPASQTIIAGASKYEFARIILDASQSGEDVRLTSLPLAFYAGAMALRTDLTNCQLYDGTLSLTTGSNVKNPATTDTVTNTLFTFDGTGYTVPKGVMKTLSVKCDLKLGTSGSTYVWGVYDNTAFTGASGVTSGQTIAETWASTTVLAMMTSSAGGTYTVAKDINYAYKIVPAGTSNVTIGGLKFTASDSENIQIRAVALQLANIASNTPSDLKNQTVGLWVDGIKVGEAQFNNSDYATSTLAAPYFTVLKGKTKTLLLKADIADKISDTDGVTIGPWISVNYDGNAVGLANGNYGIGVDSGSNISGPTTDTDAAADGIRVFKAQPIFTKLSVPSNSLTNGTMKLYRFSIKADPVSATDGVSIYKFTVNLATSTANSVQGTTSIASVKLYAFTDSAFSQPVAAFSSTAGQINTTISDPPAGDNEVVLTSVLNIPEGAIYYFQFVADVTMTAGTGTFSGYVRTYVNGDALYPLFVGAAQLMSSSTPVDANTYDNFIWSPNSTTTATVRSLDWTNGYYVSGFPSTGMEAETISK